MKDEDGVEPEVVRVGALVCPKSGPPASWFWTYNGLTSCTPQGVVRVGTCNRLPACMQFWGGAKLPDLLRLVYKRLSSPQAYSAFFAHLCNGPATKSRCGGKCRVVFAS